MRLLLSVPATLLRLAFYLLVLCTPLLGVWLVSSLVAYINAPIELTLLSGILLFPLIPVLWDGLGRSRPPSRLFTWGDRILLRTLVLNLLFIGCLLFLRPQTAFLALSTRGDWMLDGRQGESIELVRQVLFNAASRLEGLYLAVHPNPYRQYADLQLPPASPVPASSSASASLSQWPWNNAQLHPAVASLPASAETSIASVAQYLAQQEPDPFLRIKALHDYVADRITYDVPAYLGQIPRPAQDAETVFRTRKAVCAGYAKLLEALGQAIGEEIVYISGDSRIQSSVIAGGGHAWSAAKIQGNWYLMDATWDSGYVDGTSFIKQYETSYLFPPPSVMVISHFPDDPTWQLLPQPVSRGEFLRQPMLKPRFFAEGLNLVAPTRSQTDVQGDAVLQLDNPQRRWLLANYRAKDSQQSERCSNQTTQEGEIVCTLPRKTTYEVKLFSSGQRYGQYTDVGQFEFNNQ